MEKKIVLKMKTDGTIVIVINDEEKIEIAAAKRELKADELYSALSYSRGDSYTVEMVNDEGKDINVMDYFEKLLIDITTKLNNMSIAEGQSEEQSEEDELPF